MLALGTYAGWFKPVVPSGALIPLYALLALLLLDVATSRSFHGVIKAGK